MSQFLKSLILNLADSASSYFKLIVRFIFFCFISVHHGKESAKWKKENHFESNHTFQTSSRDILKAEIKCQPQKASVFLGTSFMCSLLECK